MGNTSSSPNPGREGGSTIPSPHPPPHAASFTTSSPSSSAEVCPVDHKTREIWLAQAKEKGQQIAPHPVSKTNGDAATSGPSVHHQRLQQNNITGSLKAQESAALIPKGESCDSTQMDQTPPSKPATAKVPSALQTLLNAATNSSSPLATEREISTIPRALPPEIERAQDKVRPANNEVESGADKSGKWIYPSEQMFFEAMRRKNYDPKAEDMRSIVPIHNAVNERAWAEILQWEKGKGSEACGGPKLLSFSGLSKSLTPKARFNTLLGYHAPFDRHDWVVDRCGKRVEYVIDFYAGKDEGKPGKSLNFYLDVRPKVNTWEGMWMRVSKLVGL